MMTAYWMLVPVLTLPAASRDQINLADFARVVRYAGDSPETIEVRELERGPDGWAAWRDDEVEGDRAEDAEQQPGEGGEYMIGLEWDEPRDIARVNIEFRHAIADREKIRVQYFRQHWPHNGEGGWAKLDDPFHGKWTTVKIEEWWAGDRDVTLRFAPYNLEQPGENAPDMRYRRTYRLRFLLGRDSLPPVRYLRAYGPDPVVEAAFEIDLAPESPLRPPLQVSVVNGLLLEEEGTTTQAASIDAEPIGVRYTAGDLEGPNRTIVTLRSSDDPQRGFSFIAAEAVESGSIRIPSIGATVRHVNQDHSAGRDEEADGDRSPSADQKAAGAHSEDASSPGSTETGKSIFDRVEQEPEQTWERARREIPRLRKTAQRGRPFYIPLGPPDARQEIAVNYDGSILLEKSALKARAADTDRLQWPADNWYIRLSTGEPPLDQAAEGVVRQERLDGYLPIVVNTWEAGGIVYEQTCVATFLDGEPAEIRGDETVVLLARLRMRNPGPTPARAVVRMSIDPVEALALDIVGVQAEGRVKDGKVERYPQPRSRFRLKFGEGRLSVHSPNGDGINTRVQFLQELAPGESETLILGVPFITITTQEEKDRLENLAFGFERVVQEEARRWRQIIARQAVIEVPNPLLNDFYKAQLAHILITADRDPYNGSRILPAATYSYGVCLNESCHQIRSLEIRGLHDEAERFLDAIIQGQSSIGLHGRFTDQEGVLHGLPAGPERDGKATDNYQRFNYNLDHGFSLWMLNEHYRFTRNRQWLQRHASALIAACDFVTRQRSAPAESNTLGRDDMVWGAGLLPPGHLEDPPEWLWWFAVNAYAWRGMQATAESLAEIDHPEAERIAADAAAFGEHLRRSCREAMIRAPVVRLGDGTYVPHQPTRSRLRGRDLGWIRDALYGPVHLIDCGVYPDDSPEAEWILRDTEDNVFIGQERGRRLEDFERDWFSWGGITLQSNLLPNPLIYIRRGQPKHAIRAFYNSLAANVYEDVRVFTEHPIEAYGIGQGPFLKTPDESAFIVWLRHLLINENGDVLDVLPAVPLEWLEPGQRITARGAATWFGPMDLSVVCENDRMEVTVSGPDRNPPGQVRVHLRRPPTIRSIVLNGNPVSEQEMEQGLAILVAPAGE